MAEAEKKPRRHSRFYWLRLWSLFGIFLLVAGWAWWDIKQRRERNDWERPVRVGLIVLRLGPVNDAAMFELRTRVQVLQERLAQQFTHWRHSSMVPFEFSVYGPIDVAEPPPTTQSDSLFSLAQYAYEQWRYLDRIDEKAGIPSRDLDSRVYVVARPGNAGELQFVEGRSQQDGRVGVVAVQLAESMVDFALFVATHELFHTLGATDKYDETGHAMVPDGLAEPELVPTFPQRYVEVMARNRPLSPEIEEPPASLDELRVGAATAREIGWLRE